jgi:NADPH:quinone reductase-like Zn-dependent oxidoreductase
MKATMKAVTQSVYGPPEVMTLSEIPRPAVGPGDVLVRVAAAGLNFADALLLRGEPYLLRIAGFGLRTPKQPVRGTDVAGTVEAVGRDVTTLRPGDEVFGWGDGSLAEHLSADAGHFVRKPTNVTFEQAAGIAMAGSVALQVIRDHAKSGPGQHLLVNGASGGIGTFAVQIAKAYGARVTGVCHARNVDLVRSLGADDVIDYTRQDFTTGAQRYDVILDNVGNHSLAASRRALTRTGMLIPNSGHGNRWTASLGRIIGANLQSPFISQTMRTFLSTVQPRDLAELAELIGAGTVVPVVDRTYPLNEAAAAMAHVAAGHTRGKVIVTI